MEANAGKSFQMQIIFNIFSRISLHCKLFPVQYWEYGLLVNKKDISLLTCNNLFITYYMLKKNQATKLEYKKALIKLQSKSSRKAILPAKFEARRQLKYNVQPDWSNQTITI